MNLTSICGYHEVYSIHLNQKGRLLFKDKWNQKEENGTQRDDDLIELSNTKHGRGLGSSPPIQWGRDQLCHLSFFSAISFVFPRQGRVRPSHSLSDSRKVIRANS